MKLPQVICGGDRPMVDTPRPPSSSGGRDRVGAAATDISSNSCRGRFDSANIEHCFEVWDMGVSRVDSRCPLKFSAIFRLAGSLRKVSKSDAQHPPPSRGTRLLLERMHPHP
jgi:hypothetical protein